MRRILAALLVALACGTASAQDAKEEEKQAQEKEEARLLKKARRLIQDDEKAEAWDTLQKLVALARERSHVKMEMQALEESAKAAPSEKDEAHVLDMLGFLEMQEAEWPSCAKHYTRAIEISPDDVRLNNNLGYALHMTGRDDEALTVYEHCVEVDPTYALARLSLGEIARTVGKVQKALKAHERVLERAKREDVAGENTGTWYYGFESARSKATGKGVSFANATQRRANVELQVVLDHAFLDDLDEAQKCFERAQKDLTPDDLAPAIEEALDETWRALEVRPAHFQLHYLGAFLLEAKGDAEAAKAELEKFVEAEKAARALAKKAKEKLAGEGGK